MEKNIHTYLAECQSKFANIQKPKPYVPIRKVLPDVKEEVEAPSSFCCGVSAPGNALLSCLVCERRVRFDEAVSMICNPYSEWSIHICKECSDASSSSSRK